MESLRNPPKATQLKKKKKKRQGQNSNPGLTPKPVLFVLLQLQVRGESIPGKRLAGGGKPAAGREAYPWGVCVMGVVRCGVGSQLVLLSSGAYRETSKHIHRVAQLLAVGFPETGIIRANIYLLNTYNVPGIILRILRSLFHLIYTTRTLMVFLFPFCVRKVSHSFLFEIQCKGRWCLNGSKGFLSPSTFCQHKASIAMTLFHFYSLV